MIYDAREGKTSTLDCVAGTTQFGYDDNRTLTRITDAELRVTG